MIKVCAKVYSLYRNSDIRHEGVEHMVRKKTPAKNGAKVKASATQKASAAQKASAEQV